MKLMKIYRNRGLVALAGTVLLKIWEDLRYSGSFGPYLLGNLFIKNRVRLGGRSFFFFLLVQIHLFCKLFLLSCAFSRIYERLNFWIEFL